jgi:hypothetical protein
MNHHVRLFLESIPLYVWNDHVAVQAIGQGCSLDYIEPRSLRKENMEYLACWAWTSCPSKVPHVNWVTLPARASNVPEVGRRGLERRVIIHLAIDEDHTGETVRTREHDFHLGYIDGEAQLRDRCERITGNDTPRKDKDDEDHDDGMNRHGRNDGRRAQAGVTASIASPGLCASATTAGTAVMVTAELVMAAEPLPLPRHHGGRRGHH